MDERLHRAFARIESKLDLLNDMLCRWRGVPTDKERDAAFEAYAAERRARAEWLRQLGYVPWLEVSANLTPFAREEVSTFRLMDDRAQVLVPDDMPPWFNVADLWWRPMTLPGDDERRKLLN